MIDKIAFIMGSDRYPNLTGAWWNPPIAQPAGGPLEYRQVSYLQPHFYREEFPVISAIEYATFQEIQMSSLLSKEIINEFILTSSIIKDFELDKEILSSISDKFSFELILSSLLKKEYEDSKSVELRPIDIEKNIKIGKILDYLGIIKTLKYLKVL